MTLEATVWHPLTDHHLPTYYKLVFIYSMHSLLNLVDSFLLNLPRPATAPILGLIGWESMKLEDFQVLGDYTKVWEMNQIKDFSKKVVTPSKGIFDFPLFDLEFSAKCAKLIIYFAK